MFSNNLKSIAQFQYNMHCKRSCSFFILTSGSDEISFHSCSLLYVHRHVTKLSCGIFCFYRHCITITSQYISSPFLPWNTEPSLQMSGPCLATLSLSPGLGNLFTITFHTIVPNRWRTANINIIFIFNILLYLYLNMSRETSLDFLPKYQNPCLSLSFVLKHVVL